MKDQNLEDQAMFEVTAKNDNVYFNLGTFSDLENACICIHEHIDRVDNDNIRYFVNVYNYSYTLEHKLGGCKHE